MWLEESEKIEHELLCTVKEINGSWVTVEPCRGKPEELYGLSIQGFTEKLPKIDVNVGDTLKIRYTGNIPGVSPVKISALDWSKI